jgi:hypothetical protein
MEFQESGFYVVRNFLELDFVKFIQHYFHTKICSGQGQEKKDIQAPFSFAFYGDLLMDTILDGSTKTLSNISGINLLPTYTYTRLYGKHDELIIHRDRPSCEISATLALGFPENQEINPIYFSRNEDKSDAIKIDLNLGDLCLYKGCELYHWRPKFTQDWYLQSFLHYVDANGKFKDNVYDGREYLGMPRRIGDDPQTGT